MNDLEKARKEIYDQQDKILRNFERCLKERSLESMNYFVYLHYTMNCGFLHLMDAKRFREAFSGEKFVYFLERFLHPEAGYDFSKGWNCIKMVDCEVNRKITERVREEYENILRIIENEKRNRELQALRVLADKLGYALVLKGTDASSVVIPESGQVVLL